MAAAEARAIWQRAANRCFVQEDAKRAPKLACCPSSSSSSKPHVDTGPGDASNGPEHPSSGFIPLNWNPSNSNLPPDTKWWLHLQPNFGHQKDFTYEQLGALEAELEYLRAEEVKQTVELGENDSIHMDTHKNAGSYLDSNWRVSTTCMKHDPETTMQELKAVHGNKKQLPLKDMEEYWYGDNELMDLDSVDRVISKPEKLFDVDSSWMGGEKTEPWWRTTDKDELASFVAQKSLEHIENCDLPPPQTMHVRRGPFACFESFDQDGIFFSAIDRKAPTAGLLNVTDHACGCPTCGSVNGKQFALGEKGHSLYGSDKQFSSSNTNIHRTTNKDPTETRHHSESEPSKAELLEALRHSQTRAREAEKAAQQAYNEKEHIIKLFFKQASHLFAYKQWLQLLQLETICLQFKNKDLPISTLFPVVFPWMPYKSRQWKKGKNKAKKGKSCPPGYDIGRRVVAFALGLGLAGAGLLLGWTMGWLLPMF